MSGECLVSFYVATLLAAHEIDSPPLGGSGPSSESPGVQAFVLLNLVLLVPLLCGLVRASCGPRAGAPFGVALSLAGVAASGIHSYLLAQGHPEFRLPVSMAILVATLLSACGLGWTSLRALLLARRTAQGER